MDLLIDAVDSFLDVFVVMISVLFLFQAAHAERSVIAAEADIV